MERDRRDLFCKSSRTIKMESSFDASTERECIICQFDLHLSAASCPCSPDIYACLNHAEQLCSCSSNAHCFLFRYDISELNILVQALEGRLSSVYKWAREDLGLSLSSHVSRDSLEAAGLKGSLSSSSERPVSKQLHFEISTGRPEGSHYKNHAVTTSVSQFCKDESSSSGNFASGVFAPKMHLVSQPVNVIVLSDDEDDDCKNQDSGGEDKASGNHLGISKMTGSANNSLPSVGRRSNSSLLSLRHVKEEHDEKCKPSPDLNRSNICFHTQSGVSISGASAARKPVDGCMEKTRNALQHHHEDKDKKAVMDSSFEIGGNMKGGLSSQQKRPRVAKIVRRINCNVELLDHGVVVSGKLWCTSQAIFPKGK